MIARPATSLIVLALGAFAATSLTACGEEDAKLLPGETAREITANLDTVQQLAAEGDCVGAESATEQVGEQIEALGDVDPALKRTLQDGATLLDDVVADCEETTTEAIAPADIPTTPEGTPEDEREQKDEEKQEKKEEKEREKEGEEEPAEEEGPLPPQAKGEGKGLDEEVSEPEVEEEGTSPSGGVSPGSAVGEGEEDG